MAQLHDFLISKTRVELLKTFLCNPEKAFYVRELVRVTGAQINAVRRELKRMQKRGMIKKEERGNRIYYLFRKDYLFYNELLLLVNKSIGLGEAIIKNRKKIGKVKFAMLSGRFLKGLPKGKNDVDFLIVGQIILPQIASLIQAEEARRKEEINYTVMTEEEFNFRKRRRDPFILKVLLGSRVMLIGDEEKMIKGLL